MPLKITVGQSRKLTENYNSQGFSLDIEAELPASVVDDADALAKATNHLFQLADDLLDEQVRLRSGQARQQPAATPPQRSAGRSNGNGHTYRRRQTENNGNGSERTITTAQVKTIQSMAKRLGYDPEAVTHEEFGARMADLTLKQASEMIDLLKKELATSPDQEAATR